MSSKNPYPLGSNSWGRPMLKYDQIHPEEVKGSMARREQSHIFRTPADCWWVNIFPSSMMILIVSESFALMKTTWVMTTG